MARINVGDKIASRASRAISAGECQSTMARLGCEREGGTKAIELRLSWLPQLFIKTADSKSFRMEQNRLWGNPRQGAASMSSITGERRLLGSPLTD